MDAIVATLRSEARFSPTKWGDARPLLTAAADEIERLRETARWALDLVDLYDQRLLALGEPREKVYSEAHLNAKFTARNLLTK